MPLASTAEIVTSAARDRRGVGAFNVVQLEHGQAIVSGAARADAPVILQVSENTVRYHGGLEPVALATLSVARHAAVPVAVHLDHAESPELVDEAVRLGFTSVMFDGSSLAYDGECRRHGRGRRPMPRPCRLGRSGAGGGRRQGRRACAGGTHRPGGGGQLRGRDQGRRPRRRRWHLARHAHPGRQRWTSSSSGSSASRVAVPLVLHGSSGVSDADLTRAVAAGITKVNIATRLSKAFTAAVRACLEDNPSVVDTRTYLGEAREVVAAEVGRVLEVLGYGPATAPSSSRGTTPGSWVTNRG